MFGSVREEVEDETSLSRPLAAGKAAFATRADMEVSYRKPLLLFTN